MNAELREKLVNFARALVDVGRARVIVPPNQAADGFWFGGGNMVLGEQGELVLCGRYRNAGDSRTGVEAGERGLELAVFASESFEKPFEKSAGYSKQDLSYEGSEVISIEGASLFVGDGEPELYVSTEKNIEYPQGFRDFQKSGTGVWSIDCVTESGLVRTLDSDKPYALHVKDPVVFRRDSGEDVMLYCAHPYSWSSSNTGMAVRVNRETGFTHASDRFFPRGPVWDVACARITDQLTIPRLGVFRDERPCSLYFYDGAECLRSLEENANAVSRPRGYSCEELLGVAFGYDDEFPRTERLTLYEPLVLSPKGSGCVRYVSTLVAKGQIMATWQQSQKDRSQPLMGHSLSLDQIEGLLS